VAVLITVTLGGVWVGAAVLARHRAQAAADLAALAAAARLPAGPESACREAQALAAAMRATLRGCDIAHLDVVVTVAVGTGLRIGGEARAAARAGPIEPG
jgi:secretion/DNA translocation related TadE-like protein